jgi:L-tartrate/succinate antiporter
MGRRTLALGYAVAVADLVLAPFTPSNTARSAGTIYPVIANLPPLYGSAPHGPSARRVGGFLMWTAIAVTCVTSSMFLTALAPNLLALELARATVGVNVTWMEWFRAAAPLGVVLLGVPLLAYALYPPEIKISEETPRWADAQLRAMGPVSRREVVMAALALVALVLWVFGGDRADPTSAALVVIGLMLVGRVVTWDDIVSNKGAWNTLAWFATLVTLASGLSLVGFVAWFADQVGVRMAGVTPTAAMVLLVVVFFVSHYLFASITAHVTALLPVILTVGSTVPGLPMRQFTMLLMLSLGIMGVLTPYATGPSPVYYGSGFIPPAHYWRLGAVFGAIFLIALLMIGMGGPLTSR